MTSVRFICGNTDISPKIKLSRNRRIRALAKPQLRYFSLLRRDADDDGSVARTPVFERPLIVARKT